MLQNRNVEEYSIAVLDDESLWTDAIWSLYNVYGDKDLGRQDFDLMNDTQDLPGNPE